MSACLAGTLVEMQMNVNGVSLSYIEQGKGAPVVFVHGDFSDLSTWELQREAVADQFRFIAFTQRYLGTNKWSDSGEQYSQVTHAVATIVNPTIKGILKKDHRGLASAHNAAKAGDIAESTRFFSDWTNDQPGVFDALPKETRAVHLDNGRTIALHFTASRPPKVTCADLGQLQVPLIITAGELTRPFFRILAQASRDWVPGSQLNRYQVHDTQRLPRIRKRITMHY